MLLWPIHAIKRQNPSHPLVPETRVLGTRGLLGFCCACSKHAFKLKSKSVESMDHMTSIVSLTTMASAVLFLHGGLAMVRVTPLGSLRTDTSSTFDSSSTRMSMSSSAICTLKSTLHESMFPTPPAPKTSAPVGRLPHAFFDRRRLRRRRRLLELLDFNFLTDSLSAARSFLASARPS